MISSEVGGAPRPFAMIARAMMRSIHPPNLATMVSTERSSSCVISHAAMQSSVPKNSVGSPIKILAEPVSGQQSVMYSPMIVKGRATLAKGAARERSFARGSPERSHRLTGDGGSLSPARG